MNGRVNYLFFLFMLAGSFACISIAGRQTAIAPTPSKELVFPMPSPTLPAELVCPAITEEALRLALEESSTSRNFPWDELVSLVTYDVVRGDIVSPEYAPDPIRYRQYQKDTQTHNTIWGYFTALIPENRRDLVSQFTITSDGSRGLLAAVTQSRVSPNHWELLVDVLDTGNHYELTYTLIHEFAHLLTLGPSQVPPSQAMFDHPEDPSIYFEELADCFTYFTREGCTNPGSYMDDFYNQFWFDIHEEWNRIEFETDRQEYYSSLNSFYLKYQDRFVTDYAVTRPEEDIAESFTFFVLGQKPGGSRIADQKILFFYNFPELTALRDEILLNVCENFPQ